MKTTVPHSSEYAPFYSRYIALVGAGPLFDGLKTGLLATQNFFNSLPETKWDYSYEPEKWTPKDILQHIADTERVFAYRALYFLRDVNADLVGFDENIFAQNAGATSVSKEALLTNYVAVRQATLTLIENLSTSQLEKMGIANGTTLSVRAAGYIICGHEIHHCNIIKERYLL